MVTIGIVCGGPNLERGISLNSARSLLDHLKNIGSITIFYVNKNCAFYILSAAHLYSNTPADFDFKIQDTGKPLSEAELIKALKQQDVVFPVIHGTFGEDGTLADFLHKHEINFIGSPAESCYQAFNKYNALKTLQENHYYTQPFLAIKCFEDLDKIADFWHTHCLTKVVVKSVYGGSSIDIFMADTIDQAQKNCRYFLEKNPNDFPIIEKFCEGREFTVCVLQNMHNLPVAFVPSEIHFTSQDHFFDFRKKYLPTNQVSYYCPPRFCESSIQRIRQQAEEIFKLFKLKDFARIDGWILENGAIYFSDINIICGLEQNSFLFQQAARLGIDHEGLCSYLIQKALPSHKKPKAPTQTESLSKKKVFILLGGNTAERQVSLMSGTNVWLKLQHSSIFTPYPFVVRAKEIILRVPTDYLLNHTVEEIFDQSAEDVALKKQLNVFKNNILEKLEITATIPSIPVQSFSLEEFCHYAVAENAFVFLALHGGEGEDGTIQAILDTYNIPYNGSKEETSKICIDKYATAQKIAALQHPSIKVLEQQIIDCSKADTLNLESLWSDFTRRSQANTLLIKPQKDGCSAGIAVLHNAEDLKKYMNLVKKRVSYIPAGIFLKQQNRIEMPKEVATLLIEPFIETDKIEVEQGQLKHIFIEGWIELTISVIEKENKYHALNPSITISEGKVLTVEEKFQGGTGINITPPPSSLVPNMMIDSFKRTIQEISAALNIANYARFDTFLNIKTGKIIIIECNSLPALTPSTVLFHQALAEENPLYPQQFFEFIITNALKKAAYNKF